MRRIKEVLRLRYELGLGRRQIARSCSIGQSSVFDYLKRAEAAGLRWPLPDDWDDERLERSLFAYGQNQQPSPQRLRATRFLCPLVGTHYAHRNTVEADPRYWRPWHASACR
jgi:hypothetical protein